MKYGVDGLKRRKIGGEGSSSVATRATSSSSPRTELPSISTASPRTGLPSISKVLPSSFVSVPVTVPVSETSRDESVFDRDLLDCSICIERLKSPIYQCQNGHLACASCCKLTKNVCPSCQQPTGSIRCLVLEKLIESLKVKCKYIDSGCPETVKYSERDVHEKICLYESVSCPFQNCDFQELPYMLFQDHVKLMHPEHWTVQTPERDWNAALNIFVLNPKDRYHIVFGRQLCFVVNREPIDTVSELGRWVGDMCYVTVLKLLSERHARVPSILYKLKLKIVSREDGGPSSTFTIESECSNDGLEIPHPREDGFVVVAENTSVEILDIMFPHVYIV